MALFLVGFGIGINVGFLYAALMVAASRHERKEKEGDRDG